MTKARTLLQGASWLYGAQLVTVIFQFFYAAITSRLVNSDGFGEYAAALAVVGLASLLAMGGLGQSVARLEHLDSERVRALVSYAVLLGGLSSAFVLLTATWWGWVWGIDGLAQPLRWLAISALISPILGLGTGLTGRLGRFRTLAMVSLGSNLLGMTIGTVAVITWQSAVSLTVFTIVAQTTTLVGLYLFATNGLLHGFSSLRQASSVIRFSRRITGTSLLAYMTGNLVKFSLARGIDSSSLGQFNRAEVLTSIPMQQMQNALVRAVYPEFRHDINDASRANRVWTDMMILVAWASLIVSAILAVAVPPLVPLLFGGGWEIASSLVGPLVVAGGIQMMATLLSSAMEALGRFRWIVITEVLLIVVQVIAAVFIILLREIEIAALALILTGVLRHAAQIYLLGRANYLDVRRLLLHYSVAALFAAVLAGILYGALHFLLYWQFSPGSLFLIFLIFLALLGFGYLVRVRLPVYIIAKRYGLLL